MADAIPRTSQRELVFENGRAIGMSHHWYKGQYCSILTKAGIVGCGIYDMQTPTEFDQAIAIAKSVSPITVVAGGIGSLLAGLFGFVGFFRSR